MNMKETIKKAVEKTSWKCDGFRIAVFNTTVVVFCDVDQYVADSYSHCAKGVVIAQITVGEREQVFARKLHAKQPMDKEEFLRCLE